MKGNSSTSIAGRVTAPLVGRQEELAELQQCLERAIQYETPQIVTLVGGQGMGKTRLLDHWTGRISEDLIQVRIYRSRAKPKEPAYSLFTDLLKNRFQLRATGDAAEILRAQVEEVLEDRRLTEMLHFLGSFLGVRVPENPFLRALDEAPTQHDQIARAVLRRFLEMDALRSPLLLVLDDLHLADRDSLSLFSELAESLQGAPIMMVGAFRPDLFVQRPDFCALDAEQVRLDLGPLDRQQSEQMFTRLLERVQEVPQDLVETAVNMTGGNPFFIEELVQILLDNETIQASGEIWVIDGKRAEEVALPVSVEEAVHTRIASLSSAERDVLEKAACLGSLFWLEALICFSRLQREVTDKSEIWQTDVEHQAVKDLLQELAERDFVLQIPDSSIPGATEYAFKHNLERELISKMASHQRMKQYHLFAAQWLETRLKDHTEAQLEYIGHHYALGGNNRRAAFCFVHAGDKARARYANDQAATFYTRGLELLGLEDIMAKIEALHNLGDVYTVLGRHDDALKYFVEMLHNAWLLDHRAKGAAAHRRIGRIYRTLGEYDRAASHLDSARRLFDRASDIRGVAAALDDIGQLAWIRGDYERALEMHRRALSLKRRIGNQRSIAVSLNNIGKVHQSSGSFRAANDCFTESLQIRKSVGDRVGVVDSLSNLGGAFWTQGDYNQAFELWNEALETARLIGDRLDEAYLLIKLGEALIQLGKPKEAEKHLGEASILALDLGDLRLKADCGRILGEVSLAGGDLEGARREAEAAYDICVNLGLKREMGATMRTLAEVEGAGEVTDQSRERAEQQFKQAIEIFTELGHDLELARTFASYADFMDHCGQWEDADHFRSSADEIFSRLKRVGAKKE